MSTYNTGNPVGSVDVKDLYDNAQNLDRLVNDRTVTEYPDRLGQPRKSWWGMEQDFNAFLQNSQFEYPPLNYVDGVPLTVLRETQLVQRSGQLYRVRLPASFPVNLTGTWATDAPLLTAMQDTALRQDLLDNVDPTSGAARVGRALRTFKSVKTSAGANGELRIVAGQYDREQVFVQGYYDDNRAVGGGFYYWDAVSTVADDGGTYIQVVGVTTGRWVMRERQIGPYDFGAKGDGTTDDTNALKAAIASPYAQKRPVWLGDGTFGVTSQCTLGSNVGIQGISPAKSIIKALPTYAGGGAILKWTVALGAVTGVDCRNFRVDCNNVAAHGFEMVRAYDANSVSNVMVLNTGDAYSCFRFVGLSDGGPVTIGQTLVCSQLFAGHKNSTSTAPTIFLESLQEAVFIECKAWGCYGSTKSPSNPWVLQDCRSITLVQCSAATTSGYGIRVLTSGRDSTGVNITGQLYENVDNILETAGSGGFLIIGLAHTAPRFQSPIGATAAFTLAAANSCNFDVLSSIVTLASSCASCVINCIDATKVTNSSTTTTVLQRSNSVGLVYSIQSTRGVSVWNTDHTIELLRTGVPSGGAVGLLIAHNDGTTTTLKQVTTGGADSGGTGFRYLRIPN